MISDLFDSNDSMLKPFFFWICWKENKPPMCHQLTNEVMFFSFSFWFTMKFVSLISRPLGHPAALCFSRLAGLNRRPQSCRTKLIEEWHHDVFPKGLEGKIRTPYILLGENWALSILSHQATWLCLFLLGFQYISGYSNESDWTPTTNLLPCRAVLARYQLHFSSGHQGAWRTSELAVLSLSNIARCKTKNRTLCRDPVLNRQEEIRLPNHDQTQDFLLPKIFLFILCLSPLLTSTFLRLWQQSLLSHCASSWFCSFHLWPRFC